MSAEPGEPRERILTAALQCIATKGWDKTSLSEVARDAGVSRPTLYAYFPNRDVLLVAATEHAAVRISERLIADAHEADTAGEFVVELLVSAVREFRRDPAASLMGLMQPGVSPLGDDLLSVARSFLQPLLVYRPDLEPEYDEIAETIVRFLLSIMVYESRHTRTPRQLRAYLERRLLPGLGLSDA